MSLHPGFPPRWFMQVCHAFVDINVFLRLRKQQPRFAQGQPKVIFDWKNFIEQLNLILKWILIERWGRPSMLSSMCQHVARLQFDSCAEKDSLHSNDGLNLTCLDQCHINAIVFVPMAQAPPKASAKENLLYRFERWVYILPCFGRRWFMQVCLGRPLWTLHRTTKAYSQMNADWKLEKAQYAEFNVPTCVKIAVWQLCRERQPLWNSHDSWWPEQKMFGSMPWCSFPLQSSYQSWRKRLVIRQPEFDL